VRKQQQFEVEITYAHLGSGALQSAHMRLSLLCSNSLSFLIPSEAALLLLAPSPLLIFAGAAAKLWPPAPQMALDTRNQDAAERRIPQFLKRQEVDLMATCSSRFPWLRAGV